MRHILLLALLTISLPVFADKITCYSNGKVIYQSRNAQVVDFEDNLFTIYDKEKVLFTNAVCIIRI